MQKDKYIVYIEEYIRYGISIYIKGIFDTEKEAQEYIEANPIGDKPAFGGYIRQYGIKKINDQQGWHIFYLE